MSPADDLERSIAAWLADGPPTAPPEVVGAAIDHAARHPARRRRRWDDLRWRWEASLEAGQWVPRSRLALVAVALTILMIAGLLAVGALLERRSPTDVRLVVSAGGDIWTMGIDGADARDITATPDLIERWPSWSPDGRWLAMIVEEPGVGWRLDVMAADGSRRRTLSPPTLDPRSRAPAWTPDGSAIVVAMPLGGGGFGPALLALADGSDVLPPSILPTSWAPPRWPSVSPNARSLAYVSADSSGAEQLTILDLGTGEATAIVDATTLIEGATVAAPPTWLGPDRLLIEVAGGGRSSVAVLGLDGRVVSEAWPPGIVGPGAGAVADPGGTRVAVAAAGTGSIIGLAGGSSGSFGDGANGGFALGGYAWSPDGSRLARALIGSCPAGPCVAGVAVSIAEPGGAVGPERRVWRADLPQGASRRGGFDGADAAFAGLAWRPDPPRVEGLPTAATVELCITKDQGAISTEGGVTRYRGSRQRCTVLSADPRLAGQRTVTIDIDSSVDGSGTFHGSWVLTNADGAWQGTVTGTIAPGWGRHVMAVTGMGLGAYTGWRRVETLVGDGTSFVSSGVTDLVGAGEASTIPASGGDPAATNP
jgi:hypothetical protein